MLDQYFKKPQTVDRIRESWLGEPIERYVVWLTENGYAARNVERRVPMLMHFAEFARERGATGFDQLPGSSMRSWTTGCERAAAAAAPRRQSAISRARLACP